MVAKLTTLVETHKDPGDVSFRGVHSMPAYCAEGVAKWLVSKIRPLLQPMQHMLSDSASLISTLSLIPITNATRLTKLDVKEFYLMGSLRQMVDAVVGCFAGQTAVVVEHALTFLLDHQFVSSPAFPGRIWRSKRGTGIGLTHSGDVTDLVFYLLVEKWILTPACLAAYGIVSWHRFRDDILAISSGNLDVNKVVKDIRQKVTIWNFDWKYYEANAQSLHYLDIRLETSEGIWRIHPEYKPTALRRYLNFDSAHHPAVHRSWIGMMFRRLPRRCLHVDIDRHIEVLIRRMVDGGLPERTVRGIAARVKNPSVRCQPGFSVGSRWWFPLPYNPIWSNNISREIKRINSDAGLRALLFGAFHKWNHVQISPSWSNSMPNLSQCFERLGWQEEGV